MIGRLIASFLIFGSLLAYGKGGGSDGGGGDLNVTSREDVIATVRNIYSSKLKKSVQALHHAIGRVDDPILKEVFKKWYQPVAVELGSNPSMVVYEAIAKSHFHFADGMCPVDGKMHVASVDAFKIGSEICFSMESLLKIPKENLEKQILSIAAHELTHQFGYPSEREPKAVQDFFINEAHSFIFSEVYWRAMTSTAYSVEQAVHTAVNALSQDSAPKESPLSYETSKVFCYTIGKLRAYGETMSVASQDLPNQLPDRNKLTFNEFAAFGILSERANEYCLNHSKTLTYKWALTTIGGLSEANKMILEHVGPTVP